MEQFAPKGIQYKTSVLGALAFRNVSWTARSQFSVHTSDQVDKPTGTGDLGRGAKPLCTFWIANMFREEVARRF